VIRKFTVEIDREEDGRFIAEIVDLSGVMAYGATRTEAILKCQALALRVLADRLDRGEEHDTEQLELAFVAG